MIIGTGIDIIEIKRFSHWQTYDHKKLLRIFSDQEIEYCLALPIKSAERFAVRFAAREAFYKAFSPAFPQYAIPFLTICKAITIKKERGFPILECNWSLLKISFPPTIHVSLSHSKTTAIAQIILEK